MNEVRVTGVLFNKFSIQRGGFCINISNYVIFCLVFCCIINISHYYTINMKYGVENPQERNDI